jgi:hypothetical protein
MARQPPLKHDTTRAVGRTADWRRAAIGAGSARRREVVCGTGLVAWAEHAESVAFRVFHDDPVRVALADGDQLGAQSFQAPDLSLLVAVVRRGQGDVQDSLQLTVLGNGLEQQAGTALGRRRLARYRPGAAGAWYGGLGRDEFPGLGTSMMLKDSPIEESVSGRRHQ